MRRGPRRWPRYLALALIAALGVALAWFWPGLSGNAGVGAAYGARVACACRFIGNRPLEDCPGDFPEGMGLVRLSEGENSVTARVPLIASETAYFEPGTGCVLGEWDR